jgi:hypothetical protein
MQTPRRLSMILPDEVSISGHLTPLDVAATVLPMQVLVAGLIVLLAVGANCLLVP